MGYDLSATGRLLTIGLPTNREDTFYHVFDFETDRASLVETLGRSPEMVDLSQFASAFRHSLEGSIYEAAESFFKWLNNENCLFPTAQIGPLVMVFAAPYADVLRHQSKSKLDLLQEIWGRLLIFLPNSAEPLALAMSRWMAMNGNYEKAKQILTTQLKVNPYHHSFYLENALFAVNLCLDGQDLPPQLSRFIGQEDSYLKARVCLEPFFNFFNKL